MATTYNGWRDAVDAFAVAEGWTALQWLGTQNNSTATYVPTRLHEGINGDNCWAKLPGHGSTNGAGYTTSPISGIFGTGNPLHGVDVIIVGLGTNAEDGGTFAANYLALIRQIHVLEPQARFVVQTVFSGVAVAANNASLNGGGGCWDVLQSEGIQIFRCFPTGVAVFDAVHPTYPGGYGTMATFIGPALVSALRGR